MNRKEAEDFIYSSYMKSDIALLRNVKDSEKRKPELTRSIIESLCLNSVNITVTGSKGKGSISRMISSIISERWCTGLFTSPHIVSFNERFKVNGNDISDENFILFADKAKNLLSNSIGKLKCGQFISPIGIQAIISLLYFNREYTDFNIFEYGKGVKYDDVNNIKHDYSVINTIFLEHTRELGETLEEIAEDKSTCMTGREKCIFIGEQESRVMSVLRSRASSVGVNIKVYGVDFYTSNIQTVADGTIFDIHTKRGTYENIFIPLFGDYQARNCSVAVALCEHVLGIHDFESLIRKGLNKVCYPGRLEIISSTPFILLDACINRQSAVEVVQLLNDINITGISCIIGIPDDKDFIGVVEVLHSVSKNMILTRSSNSHYIFTHKQYDLILRKGVKSDMLTETISVSEALKIAIGGVDPIVILGTTSLVSDVKRLDIKEIISNA